MNALTCAAAMAAAMLAGPASAQDREPERPSIIVTGAGHASALPDVFAVESTVQARGETQAEVLRTLASGQSRLMDQWKQLDGLTRATVTTGDIALQPRRDGPCMESNRGEDCPIVGYAGSVEISLLGAPAERAGDAVSLASDLGATTARLRDYRLSDPQSLQEQANRSAFLDARRQAEALATASGRRLGRLVRIQDPAAQRYAETGEADLGDVVVMGSRPQPDVSIAAAPEPSVARARVTVVFEIE